MGIYMIFFPKQENYLKATNNLQLIQKMKLESSCMDQYGGAEHFWNTLQTQAAERKF